MGSTPCKILMTILKIAKRRIQTNRMKDKKIDDYAQGSTAKRWHKLNVSRKEEGKSIASIKGLWMQQYNDSRTYIKKSKDKLQQPIVAVAT